MPHAVNALVELERYAKNRLSKRFSYFDPLRVRRVPKEEGNFQLQQRLMSRKIIESAATGISLNAETRKKMKELARLATRQAVWRTYEFGEKEKELIVGIGRENLEKIKSKIDEYCRIYFKARPTADSEETHTMQRTLTSSLLLIERMLKTLK